MNALAELRPVLTSDVRGAVFITGRRPYSVLYMCRDARAGCWKHCKKVRSNCIYPGGKKRKDLNMED